MCPVKSDVLHKPWVIRGKVGHAIRSCLTTSSYCIVDCVLHETRYIHQISFIIHPNYNKDHSCADVIINPNQWWSYTHCCISLACSCHSDSFSGRATNLVPPPFWNWNLRSQDDFSQQSAHVDIFKSGRCQILQLFQISFCNGQSNIMTQSSQKPWVGETAVAQNVPKNSQSMNGPLGHNSKWGLLTAIHSHRDRCGESLVISNRMQSI